MRTPFFARVTVLSCGVLAAISLTAASALRPAQLRCEYLDHPLGIDATQPRLSWIVTSDKRGAFQTAYQILVASSEARLKSGQGDLWDSGQVVSGETLQIRYAGQPLRSGQPCFWKVRVWDENDRRSAWSTNAVWEMGLLAPTDWGAKWIGRTTETDYTPAPFLRREFALPGPVKRARAYICGLGYYELHLNGGKVGDHLLDPGFTRYDRRCLYVTYDVTSQLKAGQNAVGVILGTGWYNCHVKAVWNFHEAPWRAAPKLLFRLVAELEDGRTVTVVSDEAWKTSTGPIVYDSIYGGETYDARLEKPGWDTAGFNDRDWQPALVVDAPKPTRQRVGTDVAAVGSAFPVKPATLSAQMMPPIRAFETLKPVKFTEPKPGVFVFDFGQNLAGHCVFSVTGPAGTKVRLRYGERLHPDGSLDVDDISQHVLKKWPEQQYQTDTYILKGAGAETWQSRFTYYGFQYVEVTGFPGQPTLDSLRARFTHTDVPPVGHFECSNPMLNRVQRAAWWSYLSNLQGIPTDCPHREKNGWTGDAHLAAEQADFNFFPVAVQSKWINDLGDEQRPSGELPGIVPTSGWGYDWGNGPAWDSAFLLIPYYAYVYFDDTEMFRRHFDGMKRYVDYLTTKADKGIVSIGLNDWAPYETQTGAAITSTAYYFVDAQIVALAAKVLGKPDDAAKYTQLAKDIRTAFNAKFYHPDTASYDNGSQTALSCALYQGLVETENKARVLANLVAAVEKRNNHIDTGILGAKYLLNALLENGRADVAYRIVAQQDLPSWGWWIEQGATTLWEQWKGTESRNHIMFGDVSAWFYKALAGLVPDPQAPGFEHFTVKPQLVGDLTWAKADYDSPRGRIVSDWQVDNGVFRLHLIVPANTSATVSLPVADPDEVREGRKRVAKEKTFIAVRGEAGRTVFDVGAGDYEFSGPLAR